MRLEALEIYLMVVKTGSIATAARRCYLSQPAVSMAIATLENEVGQMLLLRSPGQRKPIVLTDAGVIFTEYAQKALEDYDRMKSLMISTGGENEPFTLGMSHTPSNLILPTLVSSFKKAYPHIPFRVRTFPGYQMQHKLTTLECDISITSIVSADKGFVYERFFYDPLVLIAPKSLNLKGPLTTRQLMPLPLIVREDTCNITKILAESFRRENISMNDLNIVLQVYGNDAVMQAVSLGTGIGFVTKSLLTEFQGDKNYDVVGLKKFKVDRYLHLIRRTGTYPNGMKLFWDFALKMNWREHVFTFNTGTV